MPTKKSSAQRKINIGDCVTMRAADRHSLTFGTGADVFKVVGRDGVALILEGPMDHHPKHRKQRTMGAQLFKKTTCPREDFSVHHATKKRTPKTPAEMEREIAEALVSWKRTEAQLKKEAMMREYHVLKRTLANPPPRFSEADLQAMRSKFDALDAKLVALNTAEYLETIKREKSNPRRGGY